MTICTASIEVKSLKTVTTAATKSIGSRYKANMSVSLNGEAKIRWSACGVTAQVSVPCEHSGPDETLILDTSAIHEVLKGTTSKTLSLSAGLDGAVAKAGAIEKTIRPHMVRSSVTKINGETSVEYTLAEIPEIKIDGHAIQLDAPKFFSAVKSVLYATDDTCARYALGGVRMEFDPNQPAEIVATDGRRLAISRIYSHCAKPAKLTIPQKSIETFLSLLPKSLKGREVTIFVKECGSVVFQCDSVTLETNQLDGRYPQYSQYIPNCGESVTLDRLAILSVAKEFAVMTKKTEEPSFILKTSGDSLEVIGTGEHENSRTVFSARSTADIRIKVRPQFIFEALNSLDGNSVRIEFDKSDSPLLLTQTEGDDRIAVVMPYGK